MAARGDKGLCSARSAPSSPASPVPAGNPCRRRRTYPVVHVACVHAARPQGFPGLPDSCSLPSSDPASGRRTHQSKAAQPVGVALGVQPGMWAGLSVSRSCPGQDGAGVAAPQGPGSRVKTMTTPSGQTGSADLDGEMACRSFTHSRNTRKPSLRAKYKWKKKKRETGI